MNAVERNQVYDLLNPRTKELVNSIFRFYGVNVSKIKPIINVSDVSLGIDIGIPCGLIINELVSNSLKHAFPDDGQGVIGIDLKPKDGDNRFILEVSDSGIGFPDDLDFRNTESFGLQLVITQVEQLSGTIELDKEVGTRFKISFEPVQKEA